VRVLLIAVLLLFASCTANASPPVCPLDPALVSPKSTGKPPDLKRGVNLSRWWEDDRRHSLTSDDIAKVKAMGFDFVRLPVSPTWAENSNEADRAADLARMHCDVVSLINHGLKVVIDLHHMGAFQKNLAEQQDPVAGRLFAIWKNLKPVLDGLPTDKVLVGIYNEPQIESRTWWRTQGEVVKKLRKIYPDLTYVVTGGPDGGLWHLTEAAPYEDANLIYDFHFYEPMVLTHHGADWLSNYRPSQKHDHIVYPSSADAKFDASDDAMQAYVRSGWNKYKIEEFIDKIASWAQDHRVRVACLEFGVFSAYIESESRGNWLADVRSSLEAHDIPWAVWEYRGGFGIEDDFGKVDDNVARGLGLQSPADKK
jgi:endoglucanase